MLSFVSIVSNVKFGVNFEFAFKLGEEYMLTLILGRAGSGKTSFIYEDMALRVQKKQGGNILIVPEQYSHDAERALAQACGDSACLYAEVLSFSRMCSRVFAETGGMAERSLDNAGRVLAMCLALMNMSQQLKIYNLGSRRPDFLQGLLDTYDELRSAGIMAGDLAKFAERREDGLGDKLADLAIIFDEYEYIKESSGCDARDKLERLAQDIGDSSLGNGGRIYIDGFTDFTGQELEVIRQLMKKSCDIYVSLTCPGLIDMATVFAIPVRTANSLLSMASENGVKAQVLTMGEPSGKTKGLLYLERYLMGQEEKAIESSCQDISVIRADSRVLECTYAAARALKFMREGCRMREIAVVSPDWDSYDYLIRGVFKYHVLSLNLATLRRSPSYGSLHA